MTKPFITADAKKDSSIETDLPSPTTDAPPAAVLPEPSPTVEKPSEPEKKSAQPAKPSLDTVADKLRAAGTQVAVSIKDEKIDNLKKKGVLRRPGESKYEVFDFDGLRKARAKSRTDKEKEVASMSPLFGKKDKDKGEKTPDATVANADEKEAHAIGGEDAQKSS